MRALNLLRAAPGQPGRGLLKAFMVAAGWITADQELEQWPLFAVPKSKEDMGKLVEQVETFHMMQAQQDLQNEL